jgi:FixJ family two-component response regulator
MRDAKEISVAIVANDEDLCQSPSQMLRKAGMKPTAYASLETFLENVQSLPFDCVLLETQLNGISEIELHRQRTSSNFIAVRGCLKRRKKT